MAAELFELQYSLEKIFDLPPIAKDEDGNAYWVEDWHVLPSGIGVEEFTRKTIGDYIKKNKR